MDSLIFLDGDDTTFATMEFIIDTANQKYGQNLKFGDLTTEYDQWVEVVGEEIAKALWELGKDEKVLEIIPYLPGAVKGIERLIHYKRTPIICTSRVPEGVTERVVRKVGIVEVCYGSSKGYEGRLPKGLLAKRRGAIALVDDHIPHLIQAQEFDVHAIAYARPWNESFDGPRLEWMGSHNLVDYIMDLKIN
ncbi:MAG: hypothetical protein KJ597_06950 [Nanoarchaeota archaeon]|nr:hypothetical protein [Nanoarchaeota archaeon]MBU1623285.1 hypothetical protein [Nanoarchaeota archaeon]